MSKKVSTNARKKRRLANIVIRDGDRCWFCERRVPEEERCLYHLRSRFLGGSGEQTNQVMACKKCTDGASTVWPIDDRAQKASGSVRFRSRSSA
jgi:hypothetical protein